MFLTTVSPFWTLRGFNPCLRLFSHSARLSVKIHYEEFTSEKVNSGLAPLIVAHGMLGSLQNWTSLGRSLHRDTGRRIIAFDARNHGFSEHTQTMGYNEMAEDLLGLLDKLNIKCACLCGHSMGGRTVMYTSLTHPERVCGLIVVDISPVNKQFTVSDATEWNMSHFFHSLLAVTFEKGLSLSQARKSADSQLSLRIRDPGIRAWLLMNLYEDPATGSVGWRNNISAIHKSFETDIINFPGEKFESKTFDKPTLFIGGAKSEYIPIVDHPDIEELFPQAKIVYIEGAGHWVHSQKPYDFANEVIKFLKRIE